jgi:hypothetical protein
MGWGNKQKGFLLFTYGGQSIVDAKANITLKRELYSGRKAD